MIQSNFKENQDLIIKGTLSELSAECVLIMREIYKKNKEEFGQEVAQGILLNFAIKVITDDLQEEEKKKAAEERQVIQ